MIYFNLGPKSVALLFFFIQGLIFAFLLFKKGWETDNPANKWLSFFIFICCIYITPFMCGYANWYAKDGYRDILFFVPTQQVFLLGPVIYMYTQSLLNPTFRFTRQQALHFIPACLYLLYSLIVFITDYWVLDEYFFYANGRDKDLEDWYQISGLASMIIYAVLSIRYYTVYRKFIYRELSFADTVQFNWVNQYLLAFLLILVSRIVLFVFYPSWGDFGSKFWYYFIFSTLFYYIALMGYANKVEPIVSFNLPLESDAQGTAEGSAPPSQKQSPTSNTPPEVAEVLKDQVRHLLEAKQLYQNPTLTLTNLAEELSITSKEVSRIINQGFGKNFNDFVNDYRVKAVQKRLAAGEGQVHTILSIALDCGFNSKTTFNRVFKKTTGITPHKYLQQSLKSGANSKPVTSLNT